MQMIGFQKTGPQPCFYCGNRAEGYDHLMPRARGGDNDAGNLVPACLRCNSRKGVRTLDAYRLYIGLIERRHPVVFYGEDAAPAKRDWLFLASKARVPSLCIHNETERA